MKLRGQLRRCQEAIAWQEVRAWEEVPMLGMLSSLGEMSVSQASVQPHGSWVTQPVTSSP